MSVTIQNIKGSPAGVPVCCYGYIGLPNGTAHLPLTLIVNIKQKCPGRGTRNFRMNPRLFTVIGNIIADCKNVDSVKLSPVVSSGISAVYKNKIILCRAVKNRSGTLPLHIPVHPVINRKRGVQIRCQSILNLGSSSAV